MDVGSHHDIARDLFEVAMENVHNKVEYARDKIERLAMELYDVDLSKEEWQVLDDLVVKALTSLDRIID